MRNDHSTIQMLNKAYGFKFNMTKLENIRDREQLLKAFHPGNLFNEIVGYLLLNEEDGEKFREQVVTYALERAGELAQDRILSPQYHHLMESYASENVAGISFESILDRLRFMDPQSFLELHDNFHVYMYDVYGRQKKSPDLKVDDGHDNPSHQTTFWQKHTADRLFKHYTSNEIDWTLATAKNSNERDKRIDDLNRWLKDGAKTGAVHRYFKKYLTSNQICRPHPVDVNKGERQLRIIDQYEHFITILKEVAHTEQDAGYRYDIGRDLKNYEADFHTTYWYYGSKLLALYKSNLLDPNMEKALAVGALITWIDDPMIRKTLLDSYMSGDLALLEDDIEATLDRYEFYHQIDLDQKIDPQSSPKDYVFEDAKIREELFPKYLLLIHLIKNDFPRFVFEQLLMWGQINEQRIDQIKYDSNAHGSDRDDFDEINETDRIELGKLKKQLIPYIAALGFSRYNEQTLEEDLFRPRQLLEEQSETTDFMQSEVMKYWQVFYKKIHQFNQEKFRHFHSDSQESSGEISQYTLLMYFQKSKATNAKQKLLDAVNQLADDFYQVADITVQDIYGLDLERLIESVK